MSWGKWLNTAVQVAGTVYAANQANKGARDAANAAGQAQAGSDALQKYIFDTQMGLQQPFYQGGLSAFNEQMALMGLSPAQGGQMQANYGMQQPSQLTAEEWYLRQNPDVKDHEDYGRDPRAHYERYGRNEGRQWGVPTMQTGGNMPASTQTPEQVRQAAFDRFRSTPGYQFRLDEGRKATEASAAARGGLNSGSTLKALLRYGQNVADQGYNDYWNKLSSLWGGAQTASNAIGQAGQNYASQVGNNAWNAAQARGQSAYNRANTNIWAAGQLGNIANDWYGGYRQRGGD